MYKFHSIGQFRNTAHTALSKAQYHGQAAPQLEFYGTTKLHGANTAVYLELNNPGVLGLQSRNRRISLEDDFAGFARFMSNPQRQAVVANIFTKVKELYPALDKNKAIVVYGEWCFTQQPKGVAINQLPQMFVVFAIKITNTKEHIDLSAEESLGDNDDDDVSDADANAEDNSSQWLSPEEISKVVPKVKESLVNIYNVHDFKTWRITVDFASPASVIEKLTEYTEQVEKECPVALELGVSGMGEGIVWKCITPHPDFDTKDLVFKIKGAKHKVSNKKELTSADIERQKNAKNFADMCLTQARLEQGVDYLKEHNEEIKIENIGIFIKWLVKDCFKEELDTLKASGLDKKEVSSEISKKAKFWFIDLINQEMISPKKSSFKA